MSTDDWRIGQDGTDYLLHQQKRVALEQRRPVIRKASDLVGPGIAAGAIPLDDLNGVLGTFNGYYSAIEGTAHAPNDTEAFVGQTVSDPLLGGKQTFTGLESNTEYTRTFRRNPANPESVVWSEWSGQRVPPMGQGIEFTRSITVPMNETTTLNPPVLSFIGGGSKVFERVSNTGVRIKKPGVYTGHIQVGANSLSAGGNLGITMPQGDGMLNLMHLNQIIAPATAYFPFTFWTTVGQRVLSVNLLHVDPSPTLKWYYRMSILRVGDAT